MTSRERVLAAINHQEPDRVPIDLGGTIMSSIMAESLHRLRNTLGLENRPVKVYDVFQMLGEVELDVIEKFQVDVIPVQMPALFFKIRRENYKPWTLFDGTPVLIPGSFNVEINEKGDWLLREGGDPQARIVAHMPKDGYYFDDIQLISQIGDDLVRPSLEETKKNTLLTDEELEWMAREAELLRKETDKALLANFWAKSSLGIIHSFMNFMFLMAQDKPFVKEYLHAKNEAVMANIKSLWEVVGENIDIIGLEGFDFAGQTGELISPADYQDLYIPFYREQNDWVHQHTSWKVFQHGCGSITKLLPMLIDSGLDIINPVQCSACGMDPHWLKETYGKDITFWGGGVDTQQTLAFGTPEEVASEVQERMAIFAPGGGFVFATVHNVQYGTSTENLIAAFNAAYEYGRYPFTRK